MVFSIILFVCSWVAFLFFADKKPYFKFAPTCFIAMILGLSTDIMTDSYGLWEYPASSNLQSFWRHILDDFGVYFVIPYLFLQTLPRVQTFTSIALHIFYWSLLAIGIEFVALKTGNLKHQLWWNLGCSYTADWILYLIFYTHQKWRTKNTSSRVK